MSDVENEILKNAEKSLYVFLMNYYSIKNFEQKYRRLKHSYVVEDSTFDKFVDYLHKNKALHTIIVGASILSESPLDHLMRILRHCKKQYHINGNKLIVTIHHPFGGSQLVPDAPEEMNISMQIFDNEMLPEIKYLKLDECDIDLIKALMTSFSNALC